MATGWEQNTQRNAANGRRGWEHLILFHEQDSGGYWRARGRRSGVPGQYLLPAQILWTATCELVMSTDRQAELKGQVTEDLLVSCIHNYQIGCLFRHHPPHVFTHVCTDKDLLHPPPHHVPCAFPLNTPPVSSVPEVCCKSVTVSTITIVRQ